MLIKLVPRNQLLLRRSEQKLRPIYISICARPKRADVCTKICQYFWEKFSSEIRVDYYYGEGMETGPRIAKIYEVVNYKWQPMYDAVLIGTIYQLS